MSTHPSHSGPGPATTASCATGSCGRHQQEKEQPTGHGTGRRHLGPFLAANGRESAGNRKALREKRTATYRPCACAGFSRLRTSVCPPPGPDVRTVADARRVTEQSRASAGWQHFAVTEYAASPVGFLPRLLSPFPKGAGCCDEAGARA